MASKCLDSLILSGPSMAQHPKPQGQTLSFPKPLAGQKSLQLFARSEVVHAEEIWDFLCTRLWHEQWRRPTSVYSSLILKIIGRIPPWPHHNIPIKLRQQHHLFSCGTWTGPSTRCRGGSASQRMIKGLPEQRRCEGQKLIANQSWGCTSEQSSWKRRG